MSESLQNSRDIEFIQRKKIVVHPVITPQELLGDDYEEFSLLKWQSERTQKRDIAELAGFSLLKSKIYGYSVPHGSGTEYMAVIGNHLGGKKFNQLLLSLRPSPMFGLDTRDILTDWQKLYEPGEEDQRRKHEELGNEWSVFARDREFFLSTLKDQYQHRKWRETPKNEGILPVIHWRRSHDGQRAFVLRSFEELVDDNLGAEVIARHVPVVNGSLDVRGLNSTVGLYALAHFSPELRAKWPRSLSFNPTDRETQNHGTTQVAAYALLQKDSLKKSGFLDHLEDHFTAPDTL